MTVTKVEVHDRITEHFGRATVDDVLASLWEEDCQSCGRSIVGQRKALVVDDAISYHLAALHHLQCRPSELVDRGAILLSSTPTTTWASNIVAARSSTGQLMPMLVVNPALERVFIHPEGRGWTVAPVGMRDGLVPMGQAVIGVPVQGVRGTVTNDSVSVWVDALMHGYSAGLDPSDGTDGARLIREAGGLMLVLTSALHPHTMGPADIQRVLSQSTATLTAWAAL